MNTTTRKLTSYPAHAIKGGDRITVDGKIVEVFDNRGGDRTVEINYLDARGAVQSMRVRAHDEIRVHTAGCWCCQ